MIRILHCLVAVAVIVGSTTAASADKQRHVQVLPIDGNADAPTRAKLTTSVQRLARVIDGQVKPGVTTFADTAADAGCDPTAPTCAESVRTMLGVDELVYGTATVQGGQVTVVVRRKTETGVPREVSASFAANDSPERIEPKLLPLFSGAALPASKCPDGSDAEPCPTTPAACPEGQVAGPDGTCTPEPPKTCPNHASLGADGKCPAACANGSSPQADGSCPTVAEHHPLSRDKAIGLGATIGGGALFLIGIGMWRSKDKLQNQIDNHATDSVDDFHELQSLEDQAGSRALYGNVFVFGGLAAAGVGVWYLWKDHQAPVTVTPTLTDHAAAVTLGGRW